ncbi:MAG: recombination mediator RecR [Thermoanaerobaculia bacterium]|nr:recombination mediator RecR [Thermoanaerobaculia bacterium]
MNTPSSLDPLSKLVRELSRLPGIGQKTAARLAHHLLRVTEDDARTLAQAIVEVKEKLFHCEVCNSITDRQPCSYCSDPERDRTKICVVEEPFNIPAIERTREHQGLYHVLLGTLSPQRGIGPRELGVDRLMDRLTGVDEVILATNPDVEGEATALYLARLIKPKGIRVSRLAFGMPVGGDIEFTDEVTLGRSLAGRRAL